MQIRLAQSVEKDLRELCKIYRKICKDYDISITRQANLLLRGRLGLALQEARSELGKAKCNCND